ncbi:MAG: hypothetical protein EOP90_05580 [Lysobacteraceae bacterium]|nr:MAG: hypothetical protein EOP90_05580 [Xanthomonadaceae bacterium]
MRPILAMTVLFAAFALTACDRTETPASRRVASTPTPAAGAAIASASTGVAECDDYLAKYEACLAAKVPAEAQAMLKQSLASTRDAWAQTLAAGGKDALKSSCEMARNASRASMQAYGCSDF